MARSSIKSYNKPFSGGKSRSRGRGWYEKAVYVPDAGRRVAPRHRDVALRGSHSRPGPVPTNSHYSRQLINRGKIDLSRHKSPTMLMTKEMERKIPPLYSTEDKKPEDVTVHAHYFTPFSNWDWYITEYDGKDIMFGLVKGHEVELGYISLSELKSQGANVERDLYWSKKSLAQVMKDTNYPHYKETNNEGGLSANEVQDKKTKFVLYGTANGITKKFGTYDSQAEAETAEGLHGIELENSGFEGEVKWDIKRKPPKQRTKSSDIMNDRLPKYPKFKVGEKVERGKYDSESRKIVYSRTYTVKNRGRDEHYNWYEFEETPGRFYQHGIHKQGSLLRP